MKKSSFTVNISLETLKKIKQIMRKENLNFEVRAVNKAIEFAFQNKEAFTEFYKEFKRDKSIKVIKNWSNVKTELFNELLNFVKKNTNSKLVNKSKLLEAIVHFYSNEKEKKEVL